MKIDVTLLLSFIGGLITINFGAMFLLWRRVYKLADDKINEVRDHAMSDIRAEKEERKLCALNSNRVSFEIFGKITKLTDSIQELIRDIGDMKGMIGEVKGRVNGIKQE